MNVGGNGHIYRTLPVHGNGTSQRISIRFYLPVIPFTPSCTFNSFFAFFAVPDMTIAHGLIREFPKSSDFFGENDRKDVRERKSLVKSLYSL